MAKWTFVIVHLNNKSKYFNSNKHSRSNNRCNVMAQAQMAKGVHSPQGLLKTLHHHLNGPASRVHLSTGSKP